MILFAPRPSRAPEDECPHFPYGHYFLWSYVAHEWRCKYCGVSQ